MQGLWFLILEKMRMIGGEYEKDSYFSTMETEAMNTKLKNTRKESIYDPKLDKFIGKNLFPEQFDRAQELFSKSTFSKEVLDIINHEFSK